MKTSELSYLKSENDELSEKDAQLVSKTILQNNLVIKGEEIAFIRKSLNLPYRSFSKLLGVDPSTVLRWEQKKMKKLSGPNSLLVRSACARKMGLEVKDQSGECKIPKCINLDSKKASTEF
jgi:DNA-binding transcriptional regulator YiaG